MGKETQKHACIDRYSLEASVAMRSKISLTKFKMAIALLEIPVSGWTYLRTEAREKEILVSKRGIRRNRVRGVTLIDVRGVCLLSDLLSLLLLTIARRCGLGCLLCCFRSLGRFGRCLGGGRSRGFTSSRRWFGCHCEWCLVVERGERVEAWWWCEGKLEE
jgi:hypothetical protein